MSSKSRKFERPLGTKRYKKMFIISTEGQLTEPEYFSLFDNRVSIIKIKCLKAKKRSSPLQVLKRIEKYIKEENLIKTDEAWIVVDRDQWTDEQLSQLNRWSEKKGNYGFALSNPKFEFRLLLHFDDAKGINTSNDCSTRLKKYIPNYDKGMSSIKISDEMIQDAIKRAKQKDTGSFANRFTTVGSTVYILVENILKGK
ncbi:MAG: RloB family protein [Candidatus Delongbacteria bacterium]|nr:RloB family protein [Candidatus Delongbacteria bacterium]MCG2760675.1 RloB family protein [Candidatus Delongbacteria bacterium]